MRRLAAAAVLALLPIPLVVPAAAAHTDRGEHVLEWGHDAPADGDHLYETDFVTAYVRHFKDGVKRWRIEMKSEATGDVSSCMDEAVDGHPTELHIRCNWDTRRIGDMSHVEDDGVLADAPLAPNGPYTITVTVWNVGKDYLLSPDIPGDQPHVLPTRTVVVENPVSAPTKVMRSFDSNRRMVTVTWTGSPEPDVSEYVIEEKRDDGSWVEAGRRGRTATSFERSVKEAGVYRYRVAAHRPNTAPATSAATTPLEVAAVPQAPVSSQEPGDEGEPGGEPGVFIPEDSTTTTTTAGAPASGGAVPPPGSRPSAGGRTNAPSRPPATSRPTPRTTPTTDPGYSETLPYRLPQQGRVDGAEEGEGELAGGEESETTTKVISVPRPRDTRALLVPLAGGLTIFVLAMQMTVLIRRRPAMASAEDDFSDWSGF